jgi:hypothetical protein
MSAVYIILVLYSELPMLLIEKYIYVASLQHHQIKKYKTALGATETVTWEYNKMCLK